MFIERHALIKWTRITVFCGAHSFFWGAMTSANVIGMLAGLVTLILMFSIIDSHPRYQAKRGANPLLARALDLGVKLRLWLTVVMLLSFGLLVYIMGQVTPQSDIKKALIFTLGAPYMAEIFVGVGAMEASHWLTGVNLDAATKRATNLSVPTNIEYWSHFFATYLTTIITGLMHTVILAGICGVVYGVLKLRHRPAQPPHTAS